MANQRNLYSILSEAGFAPAQPWAHRPIVSISENGKKYIVSTSADTQCCIYHVDGVILGQGHCKCDYLLLVGKNIDGEMNPSGECFIELKGGDIAHAIEQLEATLYHFGKCNGDGIDRRARVVTNGSIPKTSMNSVFEKARVRFLKDFNCELKKIKSQQPDTPGF